MDTKSNKAKILSILGVAFAIIICILGYKAYRNYQDNQARKAITKVCKSTPPLADV